MTAEAVPLKVFARHAGLKHQYVRELKFAGRLAMADDGERVLLAESLRRQGRLSRELDVAA